MLSEHLYLYCKHEPVNWVDPSGFPPAEIALGAAGSIAIADGPLPIGDIIAAGIVIGIIIIESRGKKGKERIRTRVYRTYLTRSFVRELGIRRCPQMNVTVQAGGEGT